MKRALHPLPWALSFLLLAACNGPTDGQSAEPARIAQSTEALTLVNFCAAHQANLENIVQGMAVTYIQTAFDDTNSCAIDEYFFPAFLQRTGSRTT